MADDERQPQEPEPSFRPGPDLMRDNLRISISGFKAIHHEVSIDILPLTIISGANSGGKSSFMQPLLLMKQTLDANFDPGPLLLHGDNAKFTERSQTLTKTRPREKSVDRFSVSLEAGEHFRHLVYADTSDGLIIGSDTFGDNRRSIHLAPGLSAQKRKELRKEVAGFGKMILETHEERFGFKSEDATIDVRRDRCFLKGVIAARRNGGAIEMIAGLDAFDSHTEDWSHILSSLIHVPGLRGNPEREYPRAAVGYSFPGTFDTHVASVLLNWGEEVSPRSQRLSAHLKALGLTWKINARRKNDAAVEVRVGRTPSAQRGGAADMVSIADVGFGVSQVLPVIVSLLSARPGQMVYIEQPELHLHPRAQVALGKILVEAADRGVKVIAETHSSLLIRAIQTEIARKNISASKVSLNWFNRDVNGDAYVSIADIDEMGRFGDWPVDFDDVAEDADVDYIDAVYAGLDS